MNLHKVFLLLTEHNVTRIVVFLLDSRQMNITVNTSDVNSCTRWTA